MSRSRSLILGVLCVSWIAVLPARGQGVSLQDIVRSSGPLPDAEIRSTRDRMRRAQTPGGAATIRKVAVLSFLK